MPNTGTYGQEGRKRWERARGGSNLAGAAQEEMHTAKLAGEEQRKVLAELSSELFSAIASQTGAAKMSESERIQYLKPADEIGTLPITIVLVKHTIGDGREITAVGYVKTPTNTGLGRQAELQPDLSIAIVRGDHETPLPIYGLFPEQVNNTTNALDREVCARAKFRGSKLVLTEEGVQIAIDVLRGTPQH